MANNNKTKRYEGDDAPTYQFTSYQLVMMICAALLLMVLVFMAGSFVQGIDGSRTKSPEEAAVNTTDQDKPETSKKPETPKPANASGSGTTRKEGVQISPKPVTIPSGPASGSKTSDIKTARDAGAAYIPAPPPSRPANPIPPAPPSAQSKTTVTDTPPSAKDKPPVGEVKTEKPSETVVAKQTETPAPGATKPESATPTPSVPIKTEAPAVAAPAAAPSQTPEKTQTAQAPPPEKPLPAKEAAPSGGYTVQVASFEVAKRAVVDDYVKRIKSNSDFEVRVIPSSDGSRLRVCIGQYSDKKDADKARDELRAVKEFKGCWVLALNE